MVELLIFVATASIVYAAACGLIGRFAPVPEVPVRPECGEKPIPEDWRSDPALRFLIGLAGDAEGHANPAFAAELSDLRRAMIRAYAGGRMSGGLHNAFQQRLLPQPEVATDVEVERVLHAAAAAEYQKLRVRTSYRMDRVDALWRRLTLPRLPEDTQSAEGPCLMIRPAGEEVDHGGELEGRVTRVEEERAELDIGLQHGLGPGDLAQFAGEPMVSGLARE